MTLETLQGGSERLGPGVDEYIVVEQNVQVDGTWAITNRGHASHGTFNGLENLQEHERFNIGFNLNEQ
jgi:hypothetical protein